MRVIFTYVFLLFMMVIPAPMTAQQATTTSVHPVFSTGSYAYDETGNRISQTLSVSRRHTSNAAKKNNKYQFEQSINKKKVSVNVDSRGGVIKIEMLELAKDDNCTLTLYDISGRKLLFSPITDIHTTLNVGSFKAGYYILQIIVNEEDINWKFKY